jgi:hypothetical protein
MIRADIVTEGPPSLTEEHRAAEVWGDFRVVFFKVPQKPSYGSGCFSARASLANPSQNLFICFQVLSTSEYHHDRSI